MKNLKLSVLLFSLFILSGCAQYVTVLEANKTANISGLSNGKNYTDYTLKLDVLKNIDFKNVQLNKKNVVESLYIKDLKTGLSSTKIKPNLPKGNYILGFRSFKNSNPKEKDIISFIFMENNKTFTLEKEVTIKKKKINR